MKKLLVMVVAVCLGLLALPAVALADAVEIRAMSATEVTVSSDDSGYMAGGWIEYISPGIVRMAVQASEIDFCIDGPAGFGYCATVDTGDWGAIVPWTGESDPADYPSKKMPRRAIICEWR